MLNPLPGPVTWPQFSAAPLELNPHTFTHVLVKFVDAEK